VRHFGESSSGDWTLTVKDLREGTTGRFGFWTMKIYGFTERLPWVGLISPANNSAGAALDTAITATFSKNMNASSLQNAFHVSSGGISVSGTVAYDQAARKATFTPDIRLAYGTAYTVTINTNAQDQDGIFIPSNYTWSFTTQAPASDGGGGCFISTLNFTRWHNLIVP